MVSIRLPGVPEPAELRRSVLRYGRRAALVVAATGVVVAGPAAGSASATNWEFSDCEWNYCNGYHVEFAPRLPINEARVYANSRYQYDHSAPYSDIDCGWAQNTSSTSTPYPDPYYVQWEENYWRTYGTNPAPYDGNMAGGEFCAQGMSQHYYNGSSQRRAIAFKSGLPSNYNLATYLGMAIY